MVDCCSYQNNQIWSECLLVSIWNAARYYGINPVPEIGSVSYKKICKELEGIDEGVYPNKAKRELYRLGLMSIEGKWSYNWISKNLPVEIPVFFPESRCFEESFHSSLAVRARDGKVLLLNYKRDWRWVMFSKIKESMFNRNEHRLYKPNAIVKTSKGCRPIRSISKTYG